MKKNVRKALAISGLALAIGTSGLTLEASAKTIAHIPRVQRSVHQKIARTPKAEKTAHKSVFKRTVPGVVTEISGSTITIKSGNKSYTVNTSDTTRVLDRKWQKIDLASFATGNKIRVFGSVSGTTITAQTVRNISLPATTDSTSTSTTSSNN